MDLSFFNHKCFFSYFEVFELKGSCNSFRSIWFHFQAEEILI